MMSISYKHASTTGRTSLSQTLSHSDLLHEVLFSLGRVAGQALLGDRNELSLEQLDSDK